MRIHIPIAIISARVFSRAHRRLSPRILGPIALGIAACAIASAADAPISSAHQVDQQDRPYSWETPQAKLLPNGELAWAPLPFAYEHGDAVRYVDFAGGDDAKDGTTTLTAWKHHPWDANATGQARTATGIDTYVFKAGVEYRGVLTAAASGTPGKPIRLTRDPSWGTGAATFNGALAITGGWLKATATEAPGIPKPDNVWYQDIGAKKAASMWQVSGDQVVRMQVARWPNFNDSDPDNPVKNWPEFTAYDFNTGAFTCPDLKGLGDKHFFDGATIWSEGAFLMGSANMCSPQPGGYDPDAGTLIIQGRAHQKVFEKIPKYAETHFMAENSPKFLDAPGEFYFDGKAANGGRLYLIPANGADPNHVDYELAQDGTFIDIADQHDIVISGLSFHFNDPKRNDNYGAPCISIIGGCADITVKNCSFTNVSGAISASIYHTGGGEQLIDPPAKVLDNIIVTDNDIQHVEKSGAIYLNGTNQRSPGASYGQLRHVEVLRNHLYDTCFRHGTAPWGSLPAIAVLWAETAEIAGNIIDRSFGNGIITYGGKSSGACNVVPLTRLLVHHNQIDNTMLNCNDYGGLEHFQGGPVYLYDNVVRNTPGNSVCNRSELGYALYLDGGFKCYTFNNIVAGKVKADQPDYYNYAGYMMCYGFLDQLFNNTFYHFHSGLIGNSGNRSNILGNVFDDCEKTFIGQNQPGDLSMQGGGDNGDTGRAGIPTMAYASNVFFGKPKTFGCVAGISSTGSYRGGLIQAGQTLEELEKNLEGQKCRLGTLGWQVDAQPLADPAKHDFRPTGAETKARGVKFFAPWALARTVGEWNFYKSTANPQTVLGEAFYMTDEYFDRDMYYFLPRMDLTVSACTAENYVPGQLEDWIDGALTFDGKDRVATLTNADMTKSMNYPKNRSYDGSKRQTVDMGTNNFLIEIVFKTDPGRSAGILAGKSADSGYELAIGPDGAPMLTLLAGGAKSSVAARTTVNDGNWHHLIAEVDRAAGTAAFYIDGKPAGDARLDTIAKDASLANSADFIVGKGFSGAINFLRVCRSTLDESKTTIGELYEWEFHGPALSDFSGNPFQPGAKRDAGAIQGK